jgi:hypothetical protein
VQNRFDLFKANAAEMRFSIGLDIRSPDHLAISRKFPPCTLRPARAFEATIVWK